MEEKLELHPAGNFYLINMQYINLYLEIFLRQRECNGLNIWEFS